MKTEVTFSALDRRTQNSVTNIKKDHDKCHNLSPLYEEKTPDPAWRKWKFKMTACDPGTHLYGPASLRDTHGLIYPCERNKCVIRCPCSVCAGAVHQESGHSIQDRYHVHQQYHIAPHLNCIFCSDMMSLIPGLCFRKVITVRESGQVFPSPLVLVLRKAFEFRHNYTYPGRKNKLKCEDCEKSFKKSCNRERHMINVHYQQKYECLKCGKSLSRPDKLKKHMKVHQGVSASTADNIESSDEDLDRSDESIKELSATDTDNASTDSTESEEDEDRSEESDKELGDLPNDAKSGTDIRFTTQKVEDEVTVCETNVINMEDSDSSDSSVASRFKCEQCGNDFSTMYNLKVHLRKLKYPCQECNDDFCFKSGLSAHMKNQHRTKDFKCSTCGKEFSAKHSLKRHVQNLSVNACVQCSAVLCNAHDLKCHIFSDHTCRKCHICGGKFEYLNCHMDSVHGNSSSKTE